MQSGPQKFCVICREDCSHRPRIKDPKGHYYCKACHEKALQQRAARSRAAANDETPPAPPPAMADDDQFDVMDLIAKEAEASAASAAAACPSCFNALPAGGVVCTNCGYSTLTGQKADAAVAAPSTASPRLFDEGMGSRGGMAESAAVVRAEYVKPLVLLVGGVIVTLVAMTAFGAAAGASEGGTTGGAAVGGAVLVAVAAIYPILLVVQSLAGAAIFWLAAKTWLGDLGPAHLILLRVAGIYAAVYAVVVLTFGIGVGSGSAGFTCFGLIAAVVCFYVLTAWLFDLGFFQIVALNVFAYFVNMLLGWVIGLVMGAAST